MGKVVQVPAAMPNGEADVVMTVLPSSTIPVGVEELRDTYEKGFELCLLKLGIKWRDNLEHVPKALEVFCADEISKIEKVNFNINKVLNRCKRI
jgi:hypothetical protein